MIVLRLQHLSLYRRYARACIYVDYGTTVAGVAGVAGRLKDAEKGRKHYFKNELHLRDRVDLNSCHSGGIVPTRHVAKQNKRGKND